MQGYEYQVVAAPARGEKTRGAKSTADRFAHALTRVMNEMARDGWEYLRADTLPCEERTGFTGRATTFQHMLVFRRVLAASTDAPPAVAQRRADPVWIAPAPATAPAATAPALESATLRLGPAEGKGLAAE